MGTFFSIFFQPFQEKSRKKSQLFFFCDQRFPSTLFTISTVCDWSVNFTHPTQSLHSRSSHLKRRIPKYLSCLDRASYHSNLLRHPDSTFSPLSTLCFFIFFFFSLISLEKKNRKKTHFPHPISRSVF